MEINLYQVDLDFAVEDCVDPQSEATWWLSHHGIQATAEHLGNGPNGWPLIHFSSPSKETIEAIEAAYCL